MFAFVLAAAVASFSEPDYKHCFIKMEINQHYEINMALALSLPQGVFLLCGDDNLHDVYVDGELGSDKSDQAAGAAVNKP